MISVKKGETPKGFRFKKYASKKKLKKYCEMAVNMFFIDQYRPA